MLLNLNPLTVGSTLLPALTLLLTPLSAEAAILAGYDFTGAPGNQLASPATTLAANVSAADIIRGPGLTASTGSNSINSSGWNTVSTINLNDYYAFSITPTAGFNLSLDQLVFSERRSGTGIRTIQVRASLTNFATFTPLITLSVPDETFTRRQTIDLTTFAFLQNQTSTVSFRIYGYGAEDAGGTWRLGVAGSGDNPNNHPANLLISGNVNAPAAVPVPPAAAGILAFGALGAWKAKQRRPSELESETLNG